MTKIFIITEHLMFGQGLESLLGQVAEFEVVGQTTDPRQAIQQIKELEPEIVITYLEDAPEGPASALIIDILKFNPQIQVISLNLQTNDFCVYYTMTGITKSLDDLVRLVRSEKPAPRQKPDREDPATYPGHHPSSSMEQRCRSQSQPRPDLTGFRNQG